MFKKLFAGIGLLSLMALTASAQYYPYPFHGTVIATTTPLLISTATSNLTVGLGTNYGKVFPVGNGGVGISVSVYSPVSLSTTNFALCFQGSGDGINWIDTPANVANVVTYITPNSTTITTTYTNIPVVAAAAHNNLGNIHYLRPTWITNNNGTNWLYISNAVYSIRN